MQRARAIGRFVLGHGPAAAGRPHRNRLLDREEMLDAGARLDVRDEWFKSTPLGWACRYGRVELVKLYLERGADPVEADAEPWATPKAWASKKGHDSVLKVLRKYEH